MSDRETSAETPQEGGRFFYYIDEATGKKVDAPLLEGMLNDPVADQAYQQAIFELALKQGMPEAVARELFFPPPAA